VASLPAVANSIRDNFSASVKTLLERVIERHGFTVHPMKMKRARNHAQRATTRQASADLLNLGKLCEAFMIKNPGSRITIEKAGADVLHRIFICPGQNEKAVPVLLTNLHIDVFHGKNKEFPCQIYAMSALTNQRSVFIYSMGIAPSEDEEHWTWYLQQHNQGDIGLFINSGRAILRGDREKGEAAAAANVFPMTPKADCTFHIRGNMHRLRLFAGCSDPDAWRGVAEARTRAERDLLWAQLQQHQPRVADYLAGIDPVRWQKMRKMAGVDADGKFRHCSVCMVVGHTKTTCPVRAMFSSQDK
jgi:hypothetical protein